MKNHPVNRALTQIRDGMMEDTENRNLRRGQIAGCVALFCLFVVAAAYPIEEQMQFALGGFVMFGSVSLLSFILHFVNVLWKRRQGPRTHRPQ